jgi:hypothetical protein
VNCGETVETFGVSVNQPSTDINRYIGIAPDNTAYDKSVRTYVRTQPFSQKFLNPSATGCLSQLRSLADDVIEMTDTWVGAVPDFDATPAPVRWVSPATLREVISAFRWKEAIKVNESKCPIHSSVWGWIPTRQPTRRRISGVCCSGRPSQPNHPLPTLLEARYND